MHLTVRFLGNIAATAVCELAQQLKTALTGFGAAPWLAGIGVAFWGFAFGFIPVGVQTWIVRAAPDQPEGASGLIVAAFQIAIASGAILGGLIVDSLGPTGVIAYAGLTTLLGAGLVFAFGRKAA